LTRTRGKISPATPHQSDLTSLIAITILLLDVSDVKNLPAESLSWQNAASVWGCRQPAERSVCWSGSSESGIAKTHPGESMRKRRRL